MFATDHRNLIFSGIALATLLFGGAAEAQGFDRDGLLVDAPATPVASTLRVSGFGATRVEGNERDTRVSGAVMWSPVDGLALDAGAHWQPGTGAGPSARVRYQFLAQERTGLDLSAGMRMKMVGFHPDRAELELLLAAGKRLGKLELVLNGVFGVETEGGGKDVEVKGLLAWRFGESLRLGLEGRLQAEVEDDEELAGRTGRDFDLRAGPAASWLVTPEFQVQALAGVSAPFRSDEVGPLVALGAAFDF